MVRFQVALLILVLLSLWGGYLVFRMRARLLRMQHQVRLIRRIAVDLIDSGQTSPNSLSADVEAILTKKYRDVAGHPLFMRHPFGGRLRVVYRSDAHQGILVLADHLPSVVSNYFSSDYLWALDDVNDLPAIYARDEFAT